MTDPTAKLTTTAGYRLDYIVTAEAWHARLGEDAKLNIRKASLGGGVFWEFAIVAKPSLGPDAIKLEMFDDAFAALTDVAPLFASLAAEQPSGLDEVRVILDRLGFVDSTDRTGPDTDDTEPQEMTTADLEPLPRCDQHGTMALRPAARQTADPPCPGCDCCTLNGCYNADSADCPQDGAGYSTCPCTENDD
ncbi:hypothetical protein ABZ671_01295 [Micromonospora sp. NPDC006766]|uniref:hypothetical protein n=1 Tax=Micromonospora sp. NPDC006766 TaxID=3154778 RepID=UPI0033F70DF7